MGQHASRGTQDGSSATAGCTAAQVRHVRVSFSSQCEHHMLPFYGTAHVVYLPRGQQGAGAGGDAGSEGSQGGCGSSQLAVGQVTEAERQAVEQIVAAFTQRLQVQERITQQVADAAEQALGAAGVVVVVDAAHMCMVARGVENHAGRTTTLASRGVAVTDGALRRRALQLSRGG